MVAPESAVRACAFDQQLEVLERARHRTDRLRGDTGIERGRIELGVPEQNLDDANIDILLQQVRGEAVAQRMGRHPLLDAGRLRRLMDRAVELAGRDGLDTAPPPKQPAVWEP